MLDVNLLRAEKGFDPDRIRDLQRRRFAIVDLVDETIALDKQWRQRQFEQDLLRKEFNKINKEVGRQNMLKLDATELINRATDIKKQIEEKEKEVQAAKALLDSKLEKIGNIVHESVPISNDKADNLETTTFGERRMDEYLKRHPDLITLLDIINLDKGAEVAGEGGYYLKGDGLLLKIAIILFAFEFLIKRGNKAIIPPFFMRKDNVRKCAQLAQIDKELYTVTGEGDDKYLISSAEQPLLAYHLGDRIYPTDVPIRYVGYSTCFKKSVASDGEDAQGIFDVHQFDELVQFCITSPNDNDSWQMLQEILNNSEDFHKELGLPYRVMSVVSGELDVAAAKTFDLEAWFPGSKTYEKLASCSNFTDYKARKLGIAFGQKTNDKQAKQYAHTLNSTLTTTNKTLCCILENYQREDGVEIPAALVKYMGKSFIPFKKPIKYEKSGARILDANIFRKDPEFIRESLRRRFSDSIVDEIITRQLEGAQALIDSKLETIANIVHDSVPISDDEANNVAIKIGGERRMEEYFKNHVDLVTFIGDVNLGKGADVAGGRGYYLTGDIALLNLALIIFGLKFLVERGFLPMETPYFMTKGIMGKCAQLSQFDEDLYKVNGDDNDDKYLIATSEQPLCAYHSGDRIDPNDLPIRYVGYSTCFRKEVGSHGRDTLGIFRVHQFQKLEQFVITSPNNNDSWEKLEEMLKNSEDFIKELGLPYQVVLIVSSALNDAAAKKYDIEAWFPGSEKYRELVSCSNCTDYQSRRLGIGFGPKKDDEQEEEFVHMLNSTLTATERTICCILENYQTEDGVEVPKVLVPYMGGKTFLPFKKNPVKDNTKAASKKK